MKKHITSVVALAIALSFTLAATAAYADTETCTSTITGNNNSMSCYGKDGKDGFGTQADLANINKRMTRLNNEDMRLKHGKVDGTDLVLRVEDMAKSNGRSTIYGRDVRIDVSSLKGNTGATGSKGDTGLAGVDGTNGLAGVKGDKGADGFGTQADLVAVKRRIEQVNKEDMRVKSGTVAGDTMTLRVEDMAKSDGRSIIYSKDVNIDVSELNQSAEVSRNSKDISINSQGVAANSKGVSSNRNMNNLQNKVIVSNRNGINANSKGVSTNRKLSDAQNIVQGKAIVNNSTTITKNKTNIVKNAERIEQVNKEDHRAVGGDYDGNSGTLTINTEDMDGGSKRQFEVTGLSAASDKNATNITTNKTKIVKNKSNINTNTSNINTNANMNNAQNKVIRRHDGEINTNTSNITDNRVNINDLKQRDINTNKRIDNIFISMEDLEKNLSGGIASAIAIGQHQFDPSYKGGGQVSVAAGFYNGENALSLAAGVPVGERAFFSTSLATDSGNKGVSMGIGLTYRLK